MCFLYQTCYMVVYHYITTAAAPDRVQTNFEQFFCDRGILQFVLCDSMMTVAAYSSTTKYWCDVPLNNDTRAPATRRPFPTVGWG